MWQLIRFTLWHWRRQQKRLVNRVPQVPCGNGMATQMGHSHGLGQCASVSGRQDESYSQHQIHNPIVETKGRNTLKIDNGRARNVCNRDFFSGVQRGARLGVVCHDGSYRFWEWDDEECDFTPLDYCAASARS
jgi:hypothetical protein